MLIRSSLLLGLLLTAGNAKADQYQCHQPNSIEYFVNLDIKAYQATPNDHDATLLLSKSLEAIGASKQALLLAQKALNLSPDSGGAVVAKIHALHRIGKRQKALELAVEAFENKQLKYKFPRRLKSWLRHNILAMYLADNRLEEVEQLILKQFPKVNDLANRPKVKNSLKLGVPIHTLAPLIYVYRQTGRTALAQKLEKHLTDFTAEGFFEKSFNELSPPQQWMLGSIWVVNSNTSPKVPKALSAAYNGGFWQGWRFNYPFHPVYWPLADNKDFKFLLSTIEADMDAARTCLKNTLSVINTGKNA